MTRELREVDRIGVEGTGIFGAGLCRLVQRHDIDVVEFTRGDRQERRSHGKSDPVDAVAAARAAPSGKKVARPKSRTGGVEAIRAFRLVRRSATRESTGAIDQMRALVVAAPDELREAFAASASSNSSAALHDCDPQMGPPPREQRSSRCANCSSGAAGQRRDHTRQRRPRPTRHDHRTTPGRRDTGSAPTPQRPAWRLATTPSGSEAKHHSLTPAAAHQSMRNPG